jgi:hypothetical protein
MQFPCCGAPCAACTNPSAPRACARRRRSARSRARTIPRARNEANRLAQPAWHDRWRDREATTRSATACHTTASPARAEPGTGRHANAAHPRLGLQHASQCRAARHAARARHATCARACSRSLANACACACACADPSSRAGCAHRAHRCAGVQYSNNVWCEPAAFRFWCNADDTASTSTFCAIHPATPTSTTATQRGFDHQFAQHALPYRANTRSGVQQELSCDQPCLNSTAKGTEMKYFNRLSLSQWASAGLLSVALGSAPAVVAQDASIMLQVPVQISGVTDTSLTHVHVQCVIGGNFPAGSTWGAEATQVPLSSGAVNTVLNMRVPRMPGTTSSPVDYRCFMAFTRSDMRSFIDPSTLGPRTLIQQVTGTL